MWRKDCQGQALSQDNLPFALPEPQRVPELLAHIPPLFLHHPTLSSASATLSLEAGPAPQQSHRGWVLTWLVGDMPEGPFGSLLSSCLLPRSR